MCLAIPGRVEEILTEGDLRIGRVNFGGIVKLVCPDYVQEVQVGNSTIVHVVLALSKIDEETAFINHQRGLAGIRIFEISTRTGVGMKECWRTWRRRGWGRDAEFAVPQSLRGKDLWAMGEPRKHSG
jgi:hydrogenase assembly chaperone HypC/HupF